MSQRLLAVLALCVSVGCDGTSTLAQSAEPSQGADAALLAWSAFECSMYASISGEPVEEIERLLSLGYESGKRFGEALLGDEISEEEFRAKVPIGVSGSWGGPTVDFRIGRIYEVSSTEAYDRVVKHGDNGLDLPVAQWRTDEELKTIIASGEYRSGNCALLR